MATEMKTVPRFEISPLPEIEGGGYLGSRMRGSSRSSGQAEVYGGEWRQRAPKSLYVTLAHRGEREGVSLKYSGHDHARRRIGTSAFAVNFADARSRSLTDQAG
jgi:hypothetical protein